MIGARLRLRTKLLFAFAIVLLPMLALLWVDFRLNVIHQEESILGDQLLTAQAIAVQVDEAFDTLMGFGWAVANDPLVHTMDPRLLDAHLLELVKRAELSTLIAVYDSRGINRGWGAPGAPAEPRLDMANSPDFQRAMATDLPHVSNVLPLERLGTVGVLVVVPIRDTGGLAVGAVVVGLSTEELLRRYEHARLRPGQAILLADRTGRLAFHTARTKMSYEESGRLAGILPPREALSGVPTLQPAFYSPLLGDTRLAAFVSTERYRWVVGVTMPRAFALAPIEQAFRRELAGFLSILVVSVVLSVMLARYLIDPLHRLEAAAEVLGRGDLSGRVRIETRDELGALGEAFNAMAAHLAHLYDEQREIVRVREEFMQAAAHELKTPIATIKSSVHLVLRTPQDSETRRILQIIRRQATRMTLLIEDLLTVTRLRGALPELTLSRFDLAVLAEATVRRIAEATDNQRVVFESGEALFVEADHQLLELVLIRLLENAIATSPAGGTIEVSARREDRDAVLSVVDHGYGIPLERQRHVFEPFYEPVPSGLPGYLGVVSLRLHVCKRIIDAHGGRIWLSSEPGSTTFSFALRLAST